MFRIKVCGVTSPEDAALAVEAGADAVGINFFAESARYVDPRVAAPIVEAVGRGATVVGGFGDDSPEGSGGICGDQGGRGARACPAAITEGIACAQSGAGMIPSARGKTSALRKTPVW